MDRGNTSSQKVSEEKVVRDRLYTLPIHELKKGVKLGDTFG